MAIGNPIRPDGHFADLTFHDDHEPSFQVDLNRKTWRCWVCAIGGDAAELVKKVNKCDFPTAVKFLADLAGVASPSRGATGPPACRGGPPTPAGGPASIVSKPASPPPDKPSGLSWEAVDPR
ncbi:MAG: CHC2 zinc finger domain-containing protein [Isosphaeraceae bacterium]